MYKYCNSIYFAYDFSKEEIRDLLQMNHRQPHTGSIDVIPTKNPQLAETHIAATNPCSD